MPRGIIADIVEDLGITRDEFYFGKFWPGNVFRCPSPTPARPSAQGTKVFRLNLLPQGKAEKDRRVLNMVRQMDKEGFGNCTVTGSCEAVNPTGRASARAQTE